VKTHYQPPTKIASLVILDCDAVPVVLVSLSLLLSS